MNKISPKETHLKDNLLEKFVISSLQDARFPIFYHNLCIRRNGHIITEYDVISNNFIIEVKGGDSVEENSKQFYNQLKYLPQGFRLYCYCPGKSEEDIIKLREVFQPIIFTANLDDILQNEKRVERVNVISRRELIKLLSLPLDVLKGYQKIYTTREIYYYTYLACKYHNDYFVIEESPELSHSHKMEVLMEMDIFGIVDTFDETLPHFSTKTPKKWIEVDEGEGNKINLQYSIFLPTTRDRLQKIFVCHKFPFLEGITELCKCGQGYIFCRVKKEIKEYRCNQCS